VKRRRLVVAAAAAAVALAVTALPTARLRFLALPLAHDPSVHDANAARLAIAEDEARATETTRVPGRISAILPRSDGTVIIGTFDSGLYRFDPRHDRVPVEVGALDGRERFVDTLATYEGHVIVGTHRGALVLSPAGARLGVIAAGEAVSSLAVAGGELLVGTAHGLWRARDDAPLGERGPEGETLRVTALAATRDRVWIGTPDGVYAIATPLSAQVAYWHPLVFGSPGASSNVVTALVALGDSVLAGTDDGGVVYVDNETIDARPFGEARANDINPGALARAGSQLFVGTEGAGLIALDETRTHARRIGNTWAVRISAVAVGAQLWFGSEEGALYSLPLPASVGRPVTSATAPAAPAPRATG
jgi:ligand-binding sensor domain-containing protein